MSIQSQVVALKEHLETLFPGKWVSAGQERKKSLLTGVAEIDESLPRGLARQRITEWEGSASSGKTTGLRAVITNWCASGFNVAYVDTGNKLLASDWAFVEQGKCSTAPLSMKVGINGNLSAHGRFWVVRPIDSRRDDNQQRGSPYRRGDAMRRPYIWICSQLIRSNAFDVVVLDLGGSQSASQLSSQAHAQLQNSLGRSKTALIVVRDSDTTSSGWGCHTRLTFSWGATARYETGVNGIAMIVPTVQCSIWQDGLSKSREVTLISHVPNRLFTHPQVPDRRTPKA